MIPEEYTFRSRDPKWSGVPGISVCRDGRWSSPGLLVEGRRDCNILHAWCVGEALHLLVVGEHANKCNHLVLDPSAKKWRLHAKLPFAPSQYCARRNVGKSVHIACSEGQYVHYLSFDGASWNKPLRIEKSRNATGQVTSVRLAVDKHGVAHILWWAAGSGEHGVHGYSVVSKGQASTETVVFEKSPIERDELNLGLVPDGRVFLAYKARVPKTHPNANKIHIRYRDNGKWTTPTLVGGKANLLHGDVYTAWSRNGSFVSWLARERYSVGGGFALSSVRRYSTMDGSVWSKSKWLAVGVGHGGVFGRMMRSPTPVGPVWSGICMDNRDRVHMAWGTPSCFYAIVADLASAKTNPRKPKGLGNEPDRNIGK